jgi:hypothetical protein
MILRRGLLALLSIAVISFLVDFVSIEIPFPKRPQTRDLQLQPLLAIPAKGGKTQYEMGLPVTQTCSTSLFPQLGYPPCWYVEQQSKQPVKM